MREVSFMLHHRSRQQKLQHIQLLYTQTAIYHSGEQQPRRLRGANFSKEEQKATSTTRDVEIRFLFFVSSQSASNSSLNQSMFVVVVLVVVVFCFTYFSPLYINAASSTTSFFVVSIRVESVRFSSPILMRRWTLRVFPLCSKRPYTSQA